MSAGLGSTAEADALSLLGLDAGADAARLRQAFHAAVKASHPDRPGGDAARLRGVIDAYRTLQARPSPPPPGAVVERRTARLILTPAEAMVGVVRRLAASGGGDLMVRLPAGLRSGDWVQVGVSLLAVMIKGDGEASVIGDHLCITVAVEPSLLRIGGRVAVATPSGAKDLWVSAGDGARGLVRLRGEGLPARGGRPRGDLFVRLKPASTAAESPAQSKLRRFTADWAA